MKGLRTVQAHSKSSIHISYFFLTSTFGNSVPPTRPADFFSGSQQGSPQSSRSSCFSLHRCHRLWSSLNTKGRKKRGKEEREGRKGEREGTVPGKEKEGKARREGEVEKGRQGGRGMGTKKGKLSLTAFHSVLWRQFHQIVISKLFLNLYKNSYRWKRKLRFNTSQCCVVCLYSVDSAVGITTHHLIRMQGLAFHSEYVFLKLLLNISLWTAKHFLNNILNDNFLNPEAPIFLEHCKISSHFMMQKQWKL